MLKETSSMVCVGPCQCLGLESLYTGFLLKRPKAVMEIFDNGSRTDGRRRKSVYTTIYKLIGSGEHNVVFMGTNSQPILTHFSSHNIISRTLSESKSMAYRALSNKYTMSRGLRSLLSMKKFLKSKQIFENDVAVFITS